MFACDRVTIVGKGVTVDEDASNLIEKSREIILTKPDSGLVIIERALKLADKGNWPDTARSDLHFLKGVGLYCKDSLESSLQQFKLALQEATSAGAYNKLARIHVEISKIFEVFSDSENAIFHLEEAIRVSDSLGTNSDKANAMMRLGGIFNDQGEFEEAARVMVNALELTEKLGDLHSMCALCTNISNTFSALGNDKVSLEYARKALEVAKTACDTPNIAVALLNLGILHRGSSSDSARIYYEATLELQLNHSLPENKLKTLFNLGNLYWDQKDLKKAAQLYDSVLVISSGIPMPQGIIMALSGKAAVASESGHYDQAVALYSRALKMADSLEYKALKLQLAEHRYFTDFNNGRKAAALQSLSDWMLLKDSMAVNEKTNAVHTIEKRYQIQRREMEISRLQEARHWQEMKVRDNRIIAVLSVLSAVIAALMAYFYASLSRKRKEAYRLLMQQYEETSRRHALEVKQLLVSTTQPDGPEASPARELIRKIHDWFQTDRPYLDPQLKVDQLAEKLGVSYRMLNTALKEVEGSTFNRFINRYRVEAVIQMFKQPEFDMIKTQAIAENAGFGSVNSFYEVFQEITGMQPGQFRKMLAEKRDD